MTDSPGRSIVAAFLLTALLIAQPVPAARLWGTAEDLWGSKIDLSQLDDGVVVIHPLSTSH